MEAAGVKPHMHAGQPEQLLEVPAIIREILRRRGIEAEDDIKAFLEPSYDLHLGDPFAMADMDVAVERIIQAVNTGEKVAIYGDYDIDGITATALMLDVLRQHGLEPLCYIPDRYEEGYGLHTEALDGLKNQGATLVISVDCGITAAAEANRAREQGIDLIITDHHEVPEELPVATAVVNPHRKGDGYSFKELAGVGVAFALARALQSRTGIPARGKEKWLLDLVALGTVCDVMPLVGENRALVAFGLKVLAKTRRVGLVALAQSAGIELDEIRSYHLGYLLGPRLNAAGRLEHANYSLELVTTKDPVEAQQMAFYLEEMNHQRRLEQDRMVLEADALAATMADDEVLVLADPGWPHGVVGIVASKIAEAREKPTLVLQILGSQAKGSGRSAKGYNLINGLRRNQHLFTKLGGHHFAAGFSLPASQIDELRTAINADFAAVKGELPPKPTREVDARVTDIGMLDWELYQVLSRLEPFGHANPQPLFGLDKVKVVQADAIGKTKQHLKLKLAGEGGQVLDAIGFNMVPDHPNIRSGQTVTVSGYLQNNRFNNRDQLQIMVTDIS